MELEGKYNLESREPPFMRTGQEQEASSFGSAYKLRSTMLVLKCMVLLRAYSSGV